LIHFVKAGVVPVFFFRQGLHLINRFFVPATNYCSTICRVAKAVSKEHYCPVPLVFSSVVLAGKVRIHAAGVGRLLYPLLLRFLRAAGNGQKEGECRKEVTQGRF
jgi:hypothetical protein